MSDAISDSSHPHPLLSGKSTLLDAEAVALMAVRLAGLSQVKQARDYIRAEYFLKRKAARLLDGAALLDNAVDEMTFAAMLATAAGDPMNPRIAYFNAISFETRNGSIPGGRHGFDNADRVFRYFLVDPAHQYEINGRRPKGSEASDFSVEVCEAKSPGWGLPLKFLRLADIDVHEDATFSIRADGTPSDGRRNHLHLPANSGTVSLRDTLVDWSTELPAEVTVRRISGPERPPMSFDAMSAVAPTHVLEYAKDVFAWHDVGLEPVDHNAPPHVKPRPSPWGKPWGMTAAARFQIADDEALVFTLDPQSARYLGIQITDPWAVSVDYRHRTSSLNNLQAWHNPDGTISYIVAASDPGGVNWLDTGGLHNGAMLIRWEIIEEAYDPQTAIRSFQAVKLNALSLALPYPMPQMSIMERERAATTRYAEYLRRFRVLLP